MWGRALAALTIGAVALANTAGATPLCGTRPTPPATWAHVVWIWMENHSYGDIVGSANAPYINGSLIAGCGLATNYHNVTHPSLPNYIAATSGLPPRGLRRFKADCDPTGRCTTSAASLFTQAPSWTAYEESMPQPCATGDSGLYAVRHNPPPYYTSLAGCASFDVPYAQLQQDLAADTLPAVAFVTPNLCDDMHDCDVATGDAWLAREVPKIIASAAYQGGATAVFVTFDEGAGSRSARCVTNTRDPGCHVATIVISPSTPAGATSATLFNHYSLLRTTEELLGIATFLGQAASAPSMRAAFNL